MLWNVLGAGGVSFLGVDLTLGERSKPGLPTWSPGEQSRLVPGESRPQNDSPSLLEGLSGDSPQTSNQASSEEGVALQGRPCHLSSRRGRGRVLQAGRPQLSGSLQTGRSRPPAANQAWPAVCTPRGLHRGQCVLRRSPSRAPARSWQFPRLTSGAAARSHA